MPTKPDYMTESDVPVILTAAAILLSSKIGHTSYDATDNQIAEAVDTALRLHKCVLGVVRNQ